MKRLSKLIATLLTAILISAFVLIYVSAAMPEGVTDLGFSNDYESVSVGSTPPDILKGAGSTGTATTKVVTNYDNKYTRFEYVNHALGSKDLRTDFILGNFSNNKTASKAASAIKSGSLKGLQSYSYLTIDFDICADKYRYLIDTVVDSGTLDENGAPIMTTVTTEHLSESYPTEEGAYGIRLAYADKSYLQLDVRPIIKTTTTTTNDQGETVTSESYSYPTAGYVTLTIGLKYDSTNGVWKIYNSTSKFTTANYMATLSNKLGEWNHITYAIEVDEQTPNKALAHLYLNGEEIKSRTGLYTKDVNENQEILDFLPHAIDWTILNSTSSSVANNEKYSMGVDNWATRYYDRDYTSGDADGIDDFFGENSALSSIIECEDVVYNVDYVSPAPNKYAVIGGKKVCNPLAAAKLLANVKSGEVITTGIDLINIEAPAWTSFKINCDADVKATLSNKAIANGTTITKTDTGYTVGTGIKANMSLFTDMRFNLYLPKIDGISITSVEGATLAESAYWLNGTEMFLVSAGTQLSSFDPIDAKINYTKNGEKKTLDISLDTISYATGVAKSYDCGSEEAKLIYEIINYKEAVATYVDPDFTDETGRLSSFKAIYAAHTSCTCDDANAEVTEEETNVDYSALIEKGVTQVSYLLSLNEISVAIYTNDNVLVSQLSYQNKRGETFTHTLDNGGLVKKNGYYLVKNISAANLRNIMTITVDDATGTYSLGRYITNNPDVAVAKNLYTYSLATENYKSNVIPYKASHLILNADGSYGGSLSEELYGTGAPLNGEYDVASSDYYTVNNDYYNMPSTSERIIFPHFSSYQQTMQDSSGIACLMMILNYMGEDVRNQYTELALVNKYEELNNSKVYGKGTSETGLIKLVDSLDLGYTAEKAGLTTTVEGMKELFTQSISEGKFVMVRYQSPTDYGWKLVIGYDDLGNITSSTNGKSYDHIGDDVIIFAEPNDGADHCQDGYTTERAKDFFVWWRDMEIDGTVNQKYSYIIIDPGLDIEFDYQPVDETVKQELYELHLPLNPDGTYGGTRDSSKYGSITSGRGLWNHTESNYYKINDFYNMGSSGSRILLSNYTVLQQTMSSSCGLCAVTSVFKYYGAEGSYYDWELDYLNHYEALNAEEGPVKGQGSSTAGNAIAIEALGYKVDYNLAPKGEVPVYDTYEKYVAFISEQLLAGRPIVVTTNFGSGHFLTIIGYDDMGTDYIYDDVIVTADSCDYWDGYQDGYSLYSAYKFFSQHTNGSYAKLQQYIVIYDKKEN